MEKLDMQSMNVTAANVEKIAALFPSCVTERLNSKGVQELAIDFDKLRMELGADVLDETEERYQFTWPDKREAIRLSNARTTMTLRPCREESVDFDNTENLYIEGDNLEVLKVLQQSYLGKVKMIYIDPPYNTGSDFVYKDKRVIKAEDYVAMSGQYDEEGNQLVKNTESNGRFHTDWLNFMYPRLKVARNLLDNDGVVFISIDDNEVENLTKVCNEIFGENNFVAKFPRLTTKSGKTPLTYMISHDYVLCYVKNRMDIFIGEAYEDDSYKYEDEFLELRGKYNLKQPLDCNSISYSPSLDYPIEHEGKTYYPGSDYNAYQERKKGNYLKNDYAWRWSKELYEFGLKNGWIVFQNGRIYTKGYLKAFINKSPKGYEIAYREKERKISTIDFITNEYSNDIAKKQVLSYKINAKFDYPKPYNLVSKLLSTYYAKDGIVLDFFSGSSSTADAVMRMNIEDGGSRKFIMVQLQEPLQEGNTDNGKYKTICDIAKERIRRAGIKVKEQSRNTDSGFRVLKLDESNMKNVYYTPGEVQEQDLWDSQSNIKEDRTPEDLLFQVMPECGVKYSEKIEVLEIAGKKVFSVMDNYLAACFDEKVNEEVITAIAKTCPTYFVMRDSSLESDNVGDNFMQIFKQYSPESICKII